MLNKLVNCSCSESWQDAGKLALRVVLGAVLFMHGYQKVFEFGVGNVAQNLFQNGLGWPMPSLLAYLVSYGELIGGALLILGLLTHQASKIGIIIATVALFGVHIKNGFFLQPSGGFEYILLILAASFAIMTIGGGKYSLDEKLFKKEVAVSE